MNTMHSWGLALLQKHARAMPFAILSALLVFIASAYSTNGIWYGDFWEHSSVVKSILLNPTKPRHPFLITNSPHAFTSPYAYLVAGYVYLVGTDVISGLASFGIVNLILLLCALHYFVQSIYKHFPSNASFYALLCVLLLWGHEAWGYSGFYYYKLLPYVLPYPSTFCVAMVFFALAINIRTQGAIHRSALVTIGAITSVVLLSHPLTFIFLIIGLSGQCFRSGAQLINRHNLTLACAVLVGALLSFLWPFYPLHTLLTQGSNVFHESNEMMYEDVLIRMWPIFVSLPLAYRAWRKKSLRSVFITVTLLSAIYLFGNWSQKYSLGRTISFIALLLQICIGIGIASWEQALSAHFPKIKRFVSLALIVATVLFSLPLLMPALTRSLTVAKSLVLGRTVSNQQSYKYLVFLEDAIKPNSLVLSDIETSWKIPTFNGKVIAALHAQAFVPDDNDRRSDVANFFDRRASAETRLAIIERYKPEYLLLDKRAQYDWSQLSDAYSGASNEGLVYENEQYQLIRLKFE
jgi:hypothetical protein